MINNNSTSPKLNLTENKRKTKQLKEKTEQTKTYKTFSLLQIVYSLSSLP